MQYNTISYSYHAVRVFLLQLFQVHLSNTIKGQAPSTGQGQSVALEPLTAGGFVWVGGEAFFYPSLGGTYSSLCKFKESSRLSPLLTFFWLISCVNFLKTVKCVATAHRKESLKDRKSQFPPPPLPSPLLSHHPLGAAISFLWRNVLLSFCFR